MKKLTKYSKVFWRRVYRPVKPFINPLLKKIKLSHILILLILIMLLGSFWFGKVLPRAQESAAWWPWSAKSHAKMATGFFEKGEEKKAKKELKIANRLLFLSLTNTKTEVKKVEKKINEPDKIKQEIESWENILKKRPFYRDVLLRLAVLNYQIYENEKALEYFERAEYLDPKNEEVMKIRKIIFP